MRRVQGRLLLLLLAIVHPQAALDDEGVLIVRHHEGFDSILKNRNAGPIARQRGESAGNLVTPTPEFVRVDAGGLCSLRSDRGLDRVHLCVHLVNKYNVRLDCGGLSRLKPGASGDGRRRRRGDGPLSHR